MPSPSTAHEAATARLVEAEATATPCAPVRELFEDGTIDDGYLVQQLVAATAPDRRLVGRKVGLTSPAVQQQMGVDTPDFGLLFADMAYGVDETVPFGSLLQPRVEAEVAFVLAADLPEHRVTAADVLRATDFVVAAIEIVASRIAGWDITILDTVADNASSGAFVLGGAPRSLRDIPDLGACRMELTRAGEVVSTGTGAACLGHPVNAVTWLANTLAARGVPLRAGEVILSGSLGPLVPVHPGDSFECTIEGLGSVRTRFSD